jgi:hypothetical protein
MKYSVMRLGAWTGLRSSSVEDKVQTPTAGFSSPQRIDLLPALIAVVAFCGVLTGISLLVPPSMYSDSGFGFLAWRGTLLGATNSIISPDPNNIAHDITVFLTTWSPGQYLIPGALSSLFRVPLGIAITITVALSLVSALTGWMTIVRAFAPRTGAALLVVMLISSFRYSTLPFGIYDGGEILLQAATPWLILAAYRIPGMKAVPAAFLAASAVLLAFLAKLTGLIVVGSALLAASAVAFTFRRRITNGMVGGALGALAAVAIIYIAFLSRGWTAVAVTNWSLPLRSIAFASLAPWVAGISWTDLMAWIFLNPGRPVLHSPTALAVFMFPITALVAILIWSWVPATIEGKWLKLFAVMFYGITALTFIFLFIHGADISLDERHFRSAGTLLFLCALMSALGAEASRWTKGLFIALCGIMAIYGLTSFSFRALTMAKGQFLDRASWTNQLIVDAAAIEFAREAYRREGRGALFVLPSPEIAAALPISARVLALHLDFTPESDIAKLRYAGRVPGHVFVLMQNTIGDTAKGRALLNAFKSYDTSIWQRKVFLNTSVFFQ